MLEQNGLKHASFVLNGVRTKRWAYYYNRYATKYGYATYGAEYGYGYGYGGSERYKDQDAKARGGTIRSVGVRRALSCPSIAPPPLTLGCEQSTSGNPLAVRSVLLEDFARCVDAEAPAKTMTPQVSPRHFLLSLVTLCAFALGSVSGLAQSPPNLTHVDNVNNAGNATLYWDVFVQQDTEEFVQNEIKVFDLDQNPLGTQWHIISSEIVNGNLVLPTGWVMPSFLYDANQLAHCFIGVTTAGYGLQSSRPPFLCSIHVSIDEGATPGTVDLEWNSPCALSGEAAGGDLRIELTQRTHPRLELVDTQTDSTCTYTDNPGSKRQAHLLHPSAGLNGTEACTRATGRIWSSGWPGAGTAADQPRGRRQRPCARLLGL